MPSLRTARRAVAAALSILALAACGAGEPMPPDVRVESAWARETAPGQSAAAIYARIRNSGGGDDQLIRVSSTAAAGATLHSTSNSGGVARMRPITEPLTIGAGSTVELKPGGTHVMLTGVKARLEAGKPLELTFHFARSGPRQVTARVLPATAEAASDHHGMSM